MRITAIDIENFKGIGERVRVELAPITLLFGANSAGKSTVLHALLYLRDVLERRNLDAITTPASGIALDLGGFRQFVHGRDLSRPIRIRVEMALTGEELPEMAPNYDGPDWTDSEEDDEKSEEFEQAEEHILKSIQSAMVEIEVRWDAAMQKPVAFAYSVWLNSTLLSRIERSANSLTYSKFEFRHPAFDKHVSITDPEPTGIDSLDEALKDSVEFVIPQLPAILPNFRDKPFYQGMRDWFPDMQDPIPDFSFRGALKLPALDWDEYGDIRPEWAKSLAWNGTALLARLIIGPGRLVKEWLGNLRYIGPLRARPPRNGIPLAELDDWSEGLAAWKLLEDEQKISNERLKEVSNWFSRTDRFNSGYGLSRRRLVEVDADELAKQIAGRPTKTGLRSLLENAPVRPQINLVDMRSGLKLTPSEVGVGLSQVLPIVVAGLESPNGLVSIEQPELHIHPAMQVVLGDLFIEGALNRGTQFLIETHSEHLVLRLLRRIREGKISPGDIGVVFVEPSARRSRFSKLRIDQEGDFIDEWPGGFFEESFHEKFAGR